MYIRATVIYLMLQASQLAHSAPFYEMTAEGAKSSQIENPTACSTRIGQGGNLIEGGLRFLGKCDGQGLPPQILGREGSRFLRFATTRNATTAVKTRTELAITQENFPFYQTVFIGFKLMIPPGTSHTDASFYLMQLWQCAPAAPIAGIRLVRGPNRSHRINFMTRGDSREGSFAYADLIPGRWHSFVIAYNVNPRRGRGTAAVWMDHARRPITVNASYGHFTSGKCAGGLRPPQHYRIKFGIYKGNEPGRYFETRFDDIRIGNSYRDVVPR